MTDTKKKNAGPESKSENTDFRFSCCKPDGLFHVPEYCCPDKGSLRHRLINIIQIIYINRRKYNERIPG